MPDKPTPSARQVAMLTELVRRYDLHSDYYTSPSGKYNEHSCRDDFINEFLVILGWDVGNTKGIAPQYREVVAENYSSESERPDYTLTISGSPVFFVEAKKPSVDILRESDASLQARKYGWNAGHSIAVLTNFEDLVIFDATVMPKQGDSASVARYKRYNHSEYVSFFNDIYALLSRDSVYGGYFELIAEQQFPYSGSGTERVDRVFLGQINQWRLLIANSLLKNSESFSSEERLNDAVQDFINQIIFLRICEDKNLPVYHRLCELDATNVDASILELLKAADRRYNSGLFSETSAIRFIDNSVVSNIIEALYYPQSPYLFDIIDSNIFGQIYEMFLSERVIISENGKAELAKKREYRDRSVVSTPSEIARYIVARALSPLCAGKTPDEIKRIRCADIACGSGIFLIEAFQYLMDACLDWRYKNDPTTLVAIGGGRYKLALKEKKEILSSCLYGIDIDSHAVEIAKSMVNGEIVVFIGKKGEGSASIRLIESNGLENLESLQLDSARFQPVVSSEEKWTRYFIAPDDAYMLNELNHDPRLVPLSNLALINVGVTTGNNSYFSITDSTSNKYDLDSLTIPLIGRSSHAAGVFFTENDWITNRIAGKRARLLALNDNQYRSLSPKQKTYIDLGERQGVNKGYKCSIRNSWYSVPSTWIPDAFFLRRNNLYPKFVINECNAISTDTMHRLKFSWHGDPELMLISYYNSIAFAYTELCGRSYGGGVLEILPNEVGAVRVLNPELLIMSNETKRDIVSYIDRSVRSGANIEKVLDYVDQKVLVELVGFKQTTCATCRMIWKTLQKRRLRRGKLSEVSCFQ